MVKASMIRFFGTIFIFIILLFLYPNDSQSYRDLPDNNLSYPVLLVGKDGSTGSGFFYNKENAIYLITARHVLFKETSLSVPKEFAVPPALKHKFDIREGETNQHRIVCFHGVMSTREKTELLNAAPKAYKFSFNKAIEQLYRESQKLKLKSDGIKLFSHGQQDEGDVGLTEIEVKLPLLYERGQVKYHPSHDVAFIKIGIPEIVSDHGRMKFLEGITMMRIPTQSAT
ncbi:MAG TPA: hypothetical protein PLN83_11065 [Syntrophorhabdus sp.]|nr:hypothetical protein [Syntrophorhabdus sp.]